MLVSSATIPRLLTLVEAAEFLGMSRNAIYIACREGGEYWWVECGACDPAWQVPHYAESVG
jgi:hypothetical protein